jgi:nitrogen fixation protein NifU and related proteins
MSDLRELYQEVILDHNRNPRNFGRLAHPNRVAEGYNPLCGDQLHLELRVEDDRLLELRFEGSGCAISTASASVMTELLTGLTLEQADALYHRFHTLVTKGATGEDLDELGKLVVFGGVAEFPSRVKCATLAWHTLRAALEESGRIVSTEQGNG